MSFVLANDFSIDFADVLMIINAVTVAILLIGAYLENIIDQGARAAKTITAASAFLKGHFGAGRK